MRPIPATRLGHAHGLLRAIDKRGRLRTDEFVTEFSIEELFPPDLENALGRLRHFISYGRAAGLVKEDRGVVELTDTGRRYIRAGDADRPFEVSAQQAEWLRRQLREKHMTDSIFHGLAIGLSLLASCPPGTRVSTMDFGRSMAYLGRAGWDNENTLEIQGERHLLLLQDMELIDGDHRLTYTGEDVRTELTLPIHMSLIDIAGQLNPGGPDAVREAAEREWAEPEPEPEAPAEPEVEPDVPDQENGYHEVGLGAPSSGPPVVPRSALPENDEDSESEFVTSVASPIVTRTPPPPEPEEASEAPPETVRESVPPPVAAAAPVVDEPPVVSAAPEVSDEPPAASVPPPVVEPPVVAPVPDEVVSVPPPVAEPPAPEEPAAVTPPPPVVEPPVVAPVPDEVVSVPPPVTEPPIAPPIPDEAVVASAPPPVVEPPVAEPIPDEAVAASVPPPVAIPPVPEEAVAASVPPPAVVEDRGGSGPEFVTAAAIRAAAEGSGLRLPAGVYANVAAALATGKHLVLTGAPGSGKTTLALAIARAAAQGGRAQGATIVTAAPERALLVEAAGRGRWVVVDELDQSEDVDAAFGSLSTFLAGIPVTLASSDDATPAEDWRIVATWNNGSPAGAVLRRFAVIEVAAPSTDEVRALIERAAGGDAVASAAAGRLLAQEELAGLGAGVFLDAARHAAARNAAVPADETTLAREAFVAYVAPLHPELDAEILDAR